MATKLEADVKAGKDLHKSIQELLPTIVKESKKVLFGGNGYSEDWHKEAEGRGLPNLKSTTDVLPVDQTERHDRTVHQVQGLHREGAGKPVQHPLRKLQSSR